MPYNPYPPFPTAPNYGYPQQPPYPQAPQQPQTNVYAFVNGVEGAKSFRVNAGQSVMLMDSDEPICYMKQANALGQASIRYFRLTEIDENAARGSHSAPAGDYVSKADFDALVKRVDAMTKKEGE